MVTIWPKKKKYMPIAILFGTGSGFLYFGIRFLEYGGRYSGEGFEGLQTYHSLIGILFILIGLGSMASSYPSYLWMEKRKMMREINTTRLENYKLRSGYYHYPKREEDCWKCGSKKIKLDVSHQLDSKTYIAPVGGHGGIISDTNVVSVYTYTCKKCGHMWKTTK